MNSQARIVRKCDVNSEVSIFSTLTCCAELRGVTDFNDAGGGGAGEGSANSLNKHF